MNAVIDKTLYVTFTNYGYLPYTLNLMKSIKRAKTIWNILVVAIDKKAYEELVAQNILCIYQDFGEVPLEYIHYRNDSFNKICFIKLDIISWLLDEYKNYVDYIVYIDGDIWVKKDFHGELNKYKEGNYDIIFQCDEGHKNQCSKPTCTNLCAGFFMCRNNDIVRHLLKYSETGKYIHDQDYINKNKPNNINITTFDRNIFPNGVFVTNIPKEAMIIHYNYLEGEAKKENMKRNGHWLDF